ncbi:EamA family transporter, partial [Klebsiella pneumoniae]|nr:EamA family transporter [Klebsiella pneumoniae]
LLLAMVGWKSLYALVMLAGLWLFLPRRNSGAGGGWVRGGPVTAVVLGWIFLGQKIQGMALVGLIVVLASVLSIQRALARQAAGAKTKKAP